MNEVLRVPPISAAAIFFSSSYTVSKVTLYMRKDKVAGRIPESFNEIESGKQNHGLCCSAAHVDSTFFTQRSDCKFLQVILGRWEIWDRKQLDRNRKYKLSLTLQGNINGKKAVGSERHICICSFFFLRVLFFREFPLLFKYSNVLHNFLFSSLKCQKITEW